MESRYSLWNFTDKHFIAVSQGFPLKKPYSINILLKKDDATMKRRKRRLNPIYWVFQFFGGMVAIGSLFFIPYLVEKIVN